MVADQEEVATRHLEILLVEDNPADIRMMKEALAVGHPAHHLSVANDGEEAISFLQRAKEFADAPRPDIVILDLKLPKKDGHAVLQAIKGHPELQSIPVVVLTSSKAPVDLTMSFKLHADAFVTKPFGLSKLVSDLKIIDWLVRQPRSPAR
jgi:chemotaxis family two-component system response regulator Rcp1